MNQKLIGFFLISTGIMGLVFKSIEFLVIDKGCFGYNHVYEFVSFGAPIFLIGIGFKIYR